MFILYNGHLIREQDLHLPLSNRAFQYNDGFFETMIVRDGAIRFWDDHVARMKEASAALEIQLFQSISANKLQKQLLQLSEQNNVSNYGRVKVKVWRGGAGLYTPQTDAAAWLATAQPTEVPLNLTLQVGLCRTARTQPSPFSAFKGPNALVYVMAGHEKTQTRYDDLLLLSPKGDVAEFISSNIFWMNGNTLHTPDLKTGCINGIARRNILRWAGNNNMAVAEGFYPVESLYSADTAFAANVTGIKEIKTIEASQLQTNHPLVGELQQELFRK